MRHSIVPHGFHPLLCLGLAAIVSCSSEGGEGLARATAAKTTVVMDFLAKPLPRIPLPNDIATRYDEASATHRRINASMLGPTQMERRVRRHLDRLDGWGLLQAIDIPFSGPLDVTSITAGHRDADYDPSNDVIYLIDVTPGSPTFGGIQHLDFGQGNYPVVLEDRLNYWKNDPRGHTMSLLFEETTEDLDGDGVLGLGEDLDGDGVLDPGEDLDGDGVLDPPEDTDGDGLLDIPNYLPGASPLADDLAGRADALMTFYERQTNTVIAKPMMPLRERTTYAVVVTRRLRDADGEPVGSPYEWINHTAQTRALKPLPSVLPEGLEMSDIAFAYTFTTQTVKSDLVAVRDGLYGHGVQAALSTAFPARFETIEGARDPGHFPGMKKPHLLYGEVWAIALDDVADRFQGQDLDSRSHQILIESQRYVDFYVVGSYDSPQLFERVDDDGNTLALDDQSWPPDLAVRAAKARSERVYFTLSVPRKETSVRGNGRPAPLLIMGHGYTGNRFSSMALAGYFAKYGYATITIDAVSHGISRNVVLEDLAKSTLAVHGIRPHVEALFKDRSFDQNNSLSTDSGADFWTNYLFHTRDVVRQTILDHMQLVRILKTFDGTQRWAFDLDSDGAPELAGDFDCDGVVDFALGDQTAALGGSLGGMTSMLIGSVEPAVKITVPIAGGGGLAEAGVRSRQGGIPEAFFMRVMGPFYTGTLDARTGKLRVETIVPDLTDTAVRRIAEVDGVNIGDTIVVENLINGERGCGYIARTSSLAGAMRTAVDSDFGDRMRVLVYPGPQLAGTIHCDLRGDVAPKHVIDKFDRTVTLFGERYDDGTELFALADGMALGRGHPDLRRFQGIGQAVLDPADPSVYARHLEAEPLLYPGTGERTGAHALVLTTLGDINVPASTGVAMARAAGLIGYLHADARYGVPANQVLIDNFVTEAVHNLNRFTDPSGGGVHIDVENFSRATDRWGSDVPRLDPPLRLNRANAHGGISAAMFPMGAPTGQHVFDEPGGMTDSFQKDCKRSCTLPGDNDPCDCASQKTFDVGNFMFGLVGRYLASGGKRLETDLCQSDASCPDEITPPPARPLDQLD